MANLTLSIDDDLLRRARIRALERDTSVNAAVRQFLEDYAGSSDAEVAMTDLVALARRSSASSGPGGRAWTREELYDRGRG